MSVILPLAAEFIERMANPAYGIRVNEDCALRFAELATNEEFEALLRHDAERLIDPLALTPHGWLWLLGWARSKDIDLDDGLLLRLAEKWTSVFMQVCAIELATRRAAMEWQPRKAPAALSEFPHSWANALLRRCVETHRDLPGDAREGSVEPRSHQAGLAESVMFALLQVGSDLTLDAAATLLNHKWPGSTSMLRDFWLRWDDLDTGTKKLWKERLRPPRRPPDAPRRRPPNR